MQGLRFSVLGLVGCSILALSKLALTDAMGSGGGDSSHFVVILRYPLRLYLSLDNGE